MKVFVSSVISGFEAERNAAAEGVLTLGEEVIRAEELGAMATTPQRACLAGVRDADLVVLLLGARYGEPQDSGLSATHEEYREARDRRPILAFVQSGASPEPAQQEFIDEVRSWAAGGLTETFDSPADLKANVTRAVHRHVLATQSGAVDEDEVLTRAEQLVPAARGYGDSSLVVVVAGAPRQTVLRPAEIEAEDFRRTLLATALTSEVAVLNPAAGTEPSIEGHAIQFTQERGPHSFRLDEEGVVRVTQPATTRQDRLGTLPALVEEDVYGCILNALRFAAQVLDQVDRLHRLTDLAIVAGLVGSGWLGWRTRADFESGGGGGAIGGGTDRVVVHLAPPLRRRAALTHDVDHIAQDLTLLLRREIRHQ